MTLYKRIPEPSRIERLLIVLLLIIILLAIFIIKYIGDQMIDIFKIQTAILIIMGVIIFNGVIIVLFHFELKKDVDALKERIDKLNSKIDKLDMTQKYGTAEK